jgi:hypothetical protein
MLNLLCGDEGGGGTGSEKISAGTASALRVCLSRRVRRVEAGDSGLAAELTVAPRSLGA